MRDSDFLKLEPFFFWFSLDDPSFDGDFALLILFSLVKGVWILLKLDPLIMLGDTTLELVLERFSIDSLFICFSFA